MRKISLQWRLTILTTVLITVLCGCLTFFLYKNGVYYIYTLQETVTDQGTTPEAVYIDIPDNEWDDFAAQFATKVYNSKSDYRNRSLLITGVVALIGGAVTYFVSGRALKPLREFSETVEKVQAQNLTEYTIEENKIAELDRLRTSYNKMLLRLSESFETQRQFTGNAAHELRTPLALIQAQLDLYHAAENSENEAAAQETIQMVTEQNERLSKLVRTLLDMSELQTVARNEKIEMQGLIEEVLADLEPLAQEKNIELIQKTQNSSDGRTDGTEESLLVACSVNSNYYKEQLRIYTKVAFTCVMDYTSLTGNFETEDFTMKIAVTYDNGNIFQHFGKTETFKVYEVEDNKVVSSEVIGSNGEGHGALAGLLAGQNVDVLICGGIGGGAQTALAEAGVELCSGAQGDADQAVEAYLKGELVSRGATCDHHHHEEGHSCGDHEEGHSCGSSCGGGCGSHTTMEGKNVGKKCRTHYKGTFNDGTQFDSSYDRGEPLEFVCGAGQMIKGFDAAVADMEVGQVVDIHLMPEEAYGMPNPEAIFTVEIAELPGSEDLEVGQQVYLSNQYGQPFPVKVTAKEETTITFDANHEMAGKELNFKIELVSVE